MNTGQGMARTSLWVAVLSGLGILLTFGFQIYSTRVLGPTEFAQFASFLSVVNIAAIGSGALQNSIAVNVARQSGSTGHPSPVKKINGSLIEALVLGLGGGILVLCLVPLIPSAINGNWWLMGAAAFTIPLSFLLARENGLLQGSHRSVATVAWSTVNTGLRIALLAVALVFIADPLTALILTVTVSIGLTTIGAWQNARRVLTPIDYAPFTSTTAIVLVSTIAFAWLTNVDVLMVGSISDATLAGNYALAATIVKISLIVPGTLSLLFLSRFAATNATNERLTEWMSVGAVAVGAGVLALAGSAIISAVFGPQYDIDNGFLALVAVTFAPWVYVQALMIKTNALSIRAAAFGLVAAVAVQFVAYQLTLPNVTVAIIVNGVLGLIVAAGLKLALRRTSSKL